MISIEMEGNKMNRYLDCVNQIKDSLPILTVHEDENIIKLYASINSKNADVILNINYKNILDEMCDNIIIHIIVESLYGLSNTYKKENFDLNELNDLIEEMKGYREFYFEF